MSKHRILDAQEPFDLSLQFIKNNKRLFFDQLSQAKELVLSFERQLPNECQSEIAAVIECLTTSESVIESL